MGFGPAAEESLLVTCQLAEKLWFGVAQFLGWSRALALE
jgi:hypothetical protein